MDLIALKLDVDSSRDCDRQALIDKLFSNLTIDNKHVEFNGSTFVYCQNSVLKQKLLFLFGSQVEIETVDSNIKTLIEQQHGYLESKEDNEIVLKRGILSADIEALCSLIASSLSHSLVNTVRILLRNLNEILTNENFFAYCKRVDVNLFETINNNEMLLCHCRFESKLERNSTRILIFKRDKRSIKIKVALRKIGITRAYCDELLSENPTAMPSSND